MVCRDEHGRPDFERSSTSPKILEEAIKKDDGFGSNPVLFIIAQIRTQLYPATFRLLSGLCASGSKCKKLWTSFLRYCLTYITHAVVYKFQVSRRVYKTHCTCCCSSGKERCRIRPPNTHAHVHTMAVIQTSTKLNIGLVTNDPKPIPMHQ